MFYRLISSMFVALIIVGLHQVSSLFGAVFPRQAQLPSVSKPDPNFLLGVELNSMRGPHAPPRPSVPPYRIKPHPDADPFDLLIFEEVVEAIDRDAYLDSVERTFLLYQKSSFIPLPAYWEGGISNMSDIPGGFKVEVRSRPISGSIWSTSLSTSETYSVVNGRAFLEKPPTLPAYDPTSPPAVLTFN